MSAAPIIEIRVYPDDCDSFGHVNQAAFVRMLERARWDALARGPGVEVFSRHNVWPAVRKASVEYFTRAHVGDVLRFEASITQEGRTSFTLHQTVRRESDRPPVAEGDFLFVCIDPDGKPRPVPDEIRQFFGARPSLRSGALRRHTVRGVGTAVDVQGDGPAILFIHAFPLDRTMWRQFAAPLTGWRRIAPDLRGMGLSDVPKGRYNMAEYADDLAALLEALRVSDAVICGSSMGGYIAFEMVRRHPDHVRGLVLANTRAAADTREGKRQREETVQIVRREGSGALVERLLPKLLAPSSLSTMPHVVEHVRSMIVGAPGEGVIGALQAMKGRRDSTPLLRAINVPTLVVAGREDQLVESDEMRAMADAIPDAHFAAIPDAGHLTAMEQPIVMSRVVGEFLDSLL